MKTRPFVAVLFVMLIGCGPQAAIESPQPTTTVSQPEAAKAHVQQYIDRLKGGDQSVKLGLLGLSSVDFNSIDSIEIKSAVPTYLPDGKKVDNMVRISIHVKGYDNYKKRSIETTCDRDVVLKDGKWKIVGATF